jgi:hypothetical protein
MEAIEFDGGYLSHSPRSGRYRIALRAGAHLMQRNRRGTDETSSQETAASVGEAVSRFMQRRVKRRSRLERSRRGRRRPVGEIMSRFRQRRVSSPREEAAGQGVSCPKRMGDRGFVDGYSMIRDWVMWLTLFYIIKRGSHLSCWKLVRRSRCIGSAPSRSFYIGIDI